MKLREVRFKGESKAVVEGAGVRLHRAFGFGDTKLTDPFLLLDDFRGDREEDYIAGFPWHPHRGIETITYMKSGSVEHGDSLGNSGVIGRGDVQWMTAGSGIIHQEMPKGGPDGRMGGFQLWANLPKKQKMTAPEYRGLTEKDIPLAVTREGASVRVICGEVEGVKGPVTGVAIRPEYLDVSLGPDKEFNHSVPEGHNLMAYVYEGSGDFGNGEKSGNRSILVFGLKGALKVKAGPKGVKFLLVSGKPLNEPVAWYGPIVMNTQEELDTAYRELQEGTFVKAGS